MPIDQKAFRVAVAEVRDYASFMVAHEMCQNSEVDINSVGVSGKSALNFAFEKLFAPLLRGDCPSKDVVQYKLRIIDQLCAVSADLSALQHPDTVKLKSEVTAKAEYLMRKVTPKTPVALNELQFSYLIDALSESEKIFLAAYYMSNEIFNIAIKIAPLERTFNENVAAGKFSDIKNKLMLIFENHIDQGTTFLLLKIRQQLLDFGYTTICMEVPMTLDMAFFKSNIESLTVGPSPMKFLLAKNNDIFANNAKFIDPRTSTSGNFEDAGLFHFSSRFMGLDLYSAITEKGLFFNLCQVAAETDGKAVAILGVMHSNLIISKLKQFRIPHTVTVPFANPENLALRQTPTNTFETTSKPNHPLSLIFSKHKAMPLKITPPPTEEEMEKFITSRFKPGLS